MQNMKTKANSGEPLKQKERHIVTWSQEEDDILREQIQTHGIDNWAIIASKFKDKTTRQCRRRWFTYLNSDFKKGGWSPEEDMLLCEAQKIFGNRWTEIAKVVSGRTDNAVKNRFTTLCKKRAKHEALAKENITSYINTNNKRITLHSERAMDEITVPPMKMRRKHIPDATEDSNLEGGLLGDSRTMERPPFAVLTQNLHIINDFSNQLCANINDPRKDATSNMVQGSFLKKDDPKIIALMQQAELLSSLALKVNTEKTEQSLENAWKVVQDFLKHTKESDMVRFKSDDMDFQLETFKDLVEDLRSSNEGSQQSWRQPDLYAESPESSEYSTGSTILPQIRGDKMEHAESGLHEFETQPVQVVQPNNLVDDQEVIIPDATTNQELLSPENIATPDILPPSEEFDKDIGALCALPDIFSSPLQVTPLFRSLTAGIPSPQFSESERNFLLKTLGMESTPTNPSTRTSQPPPCKRALLHCL